VCVRGQILDEDEPCDAGGGLLPGWLGQLPLVFHEGDLGLPVGKLDDDRGGWLAGQGGVGAEAALNDVVDEGDGGDLVLTHSSREEREKEAGVDGVPQLGRVVGLG